MELLDIIISTLKIFSLVAITIVAISYFIFKMKDSKRLKPYMRQHQNEPPALDMQIRENEINSNRIKILNDPYSVPNHFQFENQNEVVLNRVKVVNEFSQRPAQNFHREAVNSGFNIYDHYASNSFEPMHKIKF